MRVGMWVDIPGRKKGERGWVLGTLLCSTSAPPHGTALHFIACLRTMSSRANMHWLFPPRHVLIVDPANNAVLSWSKVSLVEAEAVGFSRPELAEEWEQANAAAEAKVGPGS